MNFVPKEDPIYTAVRNSLAKEVCSVHQLAFEYYFQGKLRCTSCFKDALYPAQPIGKLTSLKLIFEHPVLLMLDDNSIRNMPFPLVETFLRNYEDFEGENEREVLVALLGEVEQRISNLCEDILREYDSKHAPTKERGRLSEEMYGVTARYRSQFYQMLEEGFKKGTALELQGLFCDYKRSNESPFYKIEENIAQMAEELSDIAIVDWELLKQFSANLTDGISWNPAHFIRPLRLKQPKISLAQTVLPNSLHPLVNKPYIVEYDTERISLYELNDSPDKNHWRKTTLGLQIDSLYELAGYRLIGVSYSSVFVLGYFLGHLTLIRKLQINGCTDVLPFSQYFLLVAHNKLSRIDLQTGKTKLIAADIRCSSLVYTDQDLGNQRLHQGNSQFQGTETRNRWEFSCLDVRGKRMVGDIRIGSIRFLNAD